MEKHNFSKSQYVWARASSALLLLLLLPLLVGFTDGQPAGARLPPWGADPATNPRQAPYTNPLLSQLAPIDRNVTATVLVTVLSVLLLLLPAVVSLWACVKGARFKRQWLATSRLNAIDAELSQLARAVRNTRLRPRPGLLQIVRLRTVRTAQAAWLRYGPPLSCSSVCRPRLSELGCMCQPSEEGAGGTAMLELTCGNLSYWVLRLPWAPRLLLNGRRKVAGRLRAPVARAETGRAGPSAPLEHRNEKHDACTHANARRHTDTHARKQTRARAYAHTHALARARILTHSSARAHTHSHRGASGIVVDSREGIACGLSRGHRQRSKA